jgi:hypothetical protein
MARTFTITRPGSRCIDCEQEMQNGEIAVFLGKGRYAHERPCTPAQVAAAAKGDKRFWNVQEPTTEVAVATTTAEHSPDQYRVVSNDGRSVTVMAMCTCGNDECYYVGTVYDIQHMQGR